MLKNVYAMFRFSFEILCLVILGYWGFTRIQYGNWRFFLTVLAPVLIMVIWSIWGAPSSMKRLRGISRLVLELGVYTISAFALYNTNFKEFTLWFIIIALINAGINYFTKWLI